MRIALIDPSLFTYPYDHELVTGLTATGHEVLLFGKQVGPKDPTGRDPLLRQHFYRGMAGSLWARMPRNALRVAKGLSHVGAMASLARKLRAWAPDAIHFQWLPLPAVDARFLPMFHRIAPLVLTVHDTMPFNGSPGASIQNIGALDVLRAFDHLIVHTDQGLARVTAHVGRSERIARIPHGLLHDHSTMRPPVRAVAAPDGTITFLLFGQVKPYKGVDVLLRAVARLPAAVRAKCRVKVVGKAYMDTAPLLALANELGVADAVTFDFRFVPDDELVTLLDESTVLVFPYREIEASGVLMAGIARSRPVIASRLGAFAELIEDGREGLLLPPGDDAALATALERVIREPFLLDELATGMERLRTSIPAWTGIAERTVDVYAAARRHWKRAERPLAEAERPSPLPR
ncbi:MAG TPA: glycosyltransferase [Alphaproteobacteria bacterium]|jgi:glycosyltransferase involved in cell wall biosynthesis|nr:glycosyltransferase [Alphaproteobacteria bacterium]